MILSLFGSYIGRRETLIIIIIIIIQMIIIIVIITIMIMILMIIMIIMIILLIIIIPGGVQLPGDLHFPPAVVQPLAGDGNLGK